MSESSRRPRWYGEFELAEGQSGRWDLGPLQLWLRRTLGEWRVRHEHDEARPDAVAAVALQGVDSAETETERTERFILSDGSGRVHLQPMLPDRSVVARPAAPVHVPAGEAVRLYVSAPLWLRIEVGELRKLLREVATMRPSDTWFGPNNMVGELCYAMRSRCRLTLAETDDLAYRATIPVQIRNHSSKVLVLERVNLPVRQLGLFVTPRHQFWGEEVGLERHDEGSGFAALRLGSGAPPEATGAQRVAEPRDAPGRKTAIHAFSALFG